MAKYINKVLLENEINNRINSLNAFIKQFDGISDKTTKAKYKVEALGDILLYVESQKEATINFDEDVNSLWTQFVLEKRSKNSFIRIAKYFFQAGYKHKIAMV